MISKPKKHKQRFEHESEELHYKKVIEDFLEQTPEHIMKLKRIAESINKTEFDPCFCCGIVPKYLQELWTAIKHQKENKKRFEHQMTVARHNQQEDMIETYEKEGWELTTAELDVDMWYLFFKRPV